MEEQQATGKEAAAAAPGNLMDEQLTDPAQGEPRGKVIQITVPDMKNLSKSQRTFLIVAAAVLLLVIAFAGFSCSGGLIGDDQKAYDALVAASAEFKSPSSVRVVSGAFGEGDKSDTLYAVVSAENGFGAGTSNMYKITLYRALDSVGVYQIYDADEERLARSNGINCEKVNAALAKHFGK